MTTYVLNNYYTRKHCPELLGLTMRPLYWHPTDEDLIYCECWEKPDLNGYIFYLILDNWKIE